jgi:hypothetical protein
VRKLVLTFSHSHFLTTSCGNGHASASVCREAEAVSGMQALTLGDGNRSTSATVGRVVLLRVFSAIPSVVAVGRFSRSEMSA